MTIPLLFALLICAPPAQTAATDLDLFLGPGGVRDLDGKIWQRSELAGRVVLVDAWATWCAPCLAEIPTLRRLRAEHAERVVILGVSLDTMARRDFVSWLSRHDVPWPQVFDGRGYFGPVASRLNIRSVPASFLFGPDGRLVGRDVRGRDLERAVRHLTPTLK